VLANLANAIPRGTEVFGDILVHFIGCVQANDSDATTACVIRVANLAGSGRTRVFIHGVQLIDRSGIEGRFRSAYFLAKNETSGMPVAFNVDAGTQSVIALAFARVPTSVEPSGTLRVNFQAGWTGKGRDIVFADAIQPRR
jgi:hypothetical protein